MKWYHLEGQKFGKLTVIKVARSNPAFNSKGKKTGTRKFWLCKCECGNFSEVVTASLASGKTKSCGCLTIEVCKNRIGTKHHNWKGGRHRMKEGYVIILKRNHPNTRSNGYILEHIYVMSQHLKRPLTKNENVHHINGIKDDNRIENLELWHKNHGCGQRVEDKIQYCFNFLQEYAPHLIKIEIK